MANAQFDAVIRHIRRLADTQTLATATDAQLVQRFLGSRDEAAFAALLHRHGPMVLGVCRGVLGQLEDAEDVFQATFLVLARKASSIRKTNSVAGWLHGVAYRLALRARARRSMRRIQERKASTMRQSASQVAEASPQGAMLSRPSTGSITPAEKARAAKAWHTPALLDEEMAKLPDKYRAALVLCYWEGKTQEEAAGELGCPLGTVRSRMARARKLLHERLTRRGLTLSAGSFAALVAAGSVSAAVATQLRNVTLKAALEFSGGKAAADIVSPSVALLVKAGMKGVLAANLKIATVILVLGSLVAGGASLAQIDFRSLEDFGSLAQQEAATPADDSNKPPVSRTAPKDDASSLLIDPDAGPVPAEAMARIGSTRFRHWGEVTGLAYSPDGKWLGSISTSLDDGTARIWDAATGKEKLRVPIEVSELGRLGYSPGQVPRAIGFSADSKQVLVADMGSIRGLDITTGKERFAHDLESTGKEDLPPGRPRRVNLHPGLIGAGLAPDCKTLVLAWRNPQMPQPGGAVSGRIEVRDVATGKVRASGEHPFGNYSFMPIEFSPDGARFAVVATFAMGKEQPLPIYDTASGKQIGQVRVEGKSIAQVRFLPNQEMLALLLCSGQYGYERAIGFYDLKNAKLVRTVKVDGTTYCFAVSPNGKLIFAGNGQKRFSQLIDAASGKEIGRLPSSYPGMLTFSPDANRLAAAYSGAISVYDIPARRYHPWTAEPASFFGTRFSSDGRTLLSQWGLHPVIDWRTGAVVRRPLGSEPENPQWPVSSPDGERLAVKDPKGPIRLVNTYTGKAVQTLTGAAEPAGAIVFSADGHRLAAEHWDKVIHVWDLVAGRELVQFKAPELFGADHLALSENGKVLAVSCNQVHAIGHNIVYTWDVDAQKQLARIEAPTHFFSNIALSPDGRLVAGGGGGAPPGKPPGTETAVTIWDAHTGKELCSLAGHRTGEPRPGAECEFSPDGRLLITGDAAGRLRLWEVATGQEMHRFEGHHTYVSAHFSPDGRLLVAASEDAPCFLWDVTGTAKLAGSGPLQRADRLKAVTTSLDGEKLWAQLASTDAKLAFDAIRRLAASPEPAARLLQQKLKPAAAMDNATIGKLLRDLDADAFAKREAATAELLKLADRLKPQLQEARVKASPEARRRLDQILEKMREPMPERLRESRALLALEWIATPQAGQVLAKLAAGDHDDPLTQGAAASSERLRRRGLNDRGK